MFLLLMTVLIFTNSGTEEAGRFRKHTISGKFELKGSYSGGMSWRNSDPEPVALPNYTLYVVRWTDAETIPALVGALTSDNEGNFEMKLPDGKYGFVEAADTASLDPGQWSPRKVYQEDTFIRWSHSSHWEFSFNAPVELTGDDVTGLVLTHYESNVCGLCP